MYPYLGNSWSVSVASYVNNGRGNVLVNILHRGYKQCSRYVPARQ